MKTLFALLIFALACSVSVSSQGLEWKRLDTLREPRFMHSSVYLGNGEILVMGGFANARGNWGVASNTCEIINVYTKSVSSAATMFSSRAEFPALLSPDGNVVVIGGCMSDSRSPNSIGNRNTNTVEVFDKTTRAWTVVGTTLVARRQHTAAFINAEEIVIVGGRKDDLGTLSSVEIFNIRTGSSQFITPYPAEVNVPTMLLSSTGEIHCFGGRSGGGNSSRPKGIYAFNITTRTWEQKGELPSGTQAHFASNLWGGNIALTGGWISDAPAIGLKNVIIEVNNRYVNFGELVEPKANMNILQMNYDEFLVVGGMNDRLQCSNTCERINLSTGASSTFPTMIEPHNFFTSHSIPLEVDDYGHVTRAISVVISGMRKIFASGSNEMSDIQSTPLIEYIETNDNPDPIICSNTKRGIDFGKGFASYIKSSNLELAKSTNLNRSALSMVSPGSVNTGSAWYATKQEVGCGFTSQFSFITTNNGSSTSSKDALRFIIQNNSSPKTTSTKESTLVPNSLNIAFTTSEANTSIIDISTISTDVKNQNSIAIAPLSIKNNTVYHVKVDYNNVPNAMRVFIDTDASFKSPAIIIPSLDPSTLLTLDNKLSAWVGFSTSQNESKSSVDILSWQFCPCTSGIISSIENNGDNTNNWARVYPQPALDKATLVWKGIPSSATNIELSTMLGTPILQEQTTTPSDGLGQYSIDANSLSSGTYMYRITTNTATHQGTIVIVK